MNFILIRLRKPGYVNEEHPDVWCVATGWFEGVWPTADAAKGEAEFATGFTDCYGVLTGEYRLSWTEVEAENFEFKSYLTRGYHPRRIFKAPYPKTTEELSAGAPWTGLWLLCDHTEDRDP